MNLRNLTASISLLLTFVATLPINAEEDSPLDAWQRAEYHKRFMAQISAGMLTPDSLTELKDKNLALQYYQAG